MIISLLVNQSLIHLHRIVYLPNVIIGILCDKNRKPYGRGGSFCMYDARGPQSGVNSNLIFGIAIIAVIAIAFFGILLMPSGNNTAKPVPFAASGQNSTSADMPVLMAGIDDPTTQTFIATLQRVSPESTSRIQSKVTTALGNGAGQDEVVQLVMQEIQKDLPRMAAHLAKADVKHFDKILKHTKTGLQLMQKGNGKWCKGSTYEQFASKGPVAAQRMFERNFAYGSEGYKWSIGFSTLLLEAVEAGQKNPKTYGKMTSRDEAALQGVMFKMIADPQIMKLMQMQGSSQADMIKASRNLNFCSIGVTLLNSVNGLPQETRGRLWGEAMRQAKSADFKKQLNGMGGMGMLGAS